MCPSAGLYFGREVSADSEEGKLPLHGPNQWPSPVSSGNASQKIVATTSCQLLINQPLLRHAGHACPCMPISASASHITARMAPRLVPIGGRAASTDFAIYQGRGVLSQPQTQNGHCILCCRDAAHST